MAETRQLAILIAVTLILGVVAVAASTTLSSLNLTGPAVVDKYVAHLKPDGTLTEFYTYTFTVQQYHMLYRSWEVPVSLTPLDFPYIQPIKVDSPPGSVAYVKDQNGDVTILSPGESNQIVADTIDNLADYNEVGCYYAPSFQPGSYNIDYTFKVFPPIEYDSTYDHLNLMLADVHIPYKNVTVIIDNASYVDAVYAHPPSLKVSRTGNQITISGSAAQDELLEVELLMTPGAHQIEGFRTPVSDVKGKTDSANFWYSLQYNAANGLGLAGEIIVILVPFLLLFIYFRYGREEEVTVPTYLSNVPNKDRKPWLVNLVFRKDIFDFDEDGFYATLLDLHLRKKIRLEPRDHGMKIYILDPSTDDDYEKRVIGFLQKLAKDGVFDTDTLRDLAHDIKNGKGSYTQAVAVQEDLQGLTRRVDKNTVGQFAVSGRVKVIPIALLGVAVLVGAIILLSTAPVVGYLLAVPFAMGVVVLIQCVIAAFFPSTLLGRWETGMYKEKLEWGAFRRHLGDLAQLRKYPTEDLSMWGDWLVYGTALGVGDRVAQAMRELNVNLDVARFSPMMPLWFYPIIVATPPSRGGGGGGGFHGGGGLRRWWWLWRRWRRSPLGPRGYF